jgi:hypothetical protein
MKLRKQASVNMEFKTVLEIWNRIIRSLITFATSTKYKFSTMLLVS